MLTWGRVQRVCRHFVAIWSVSGLSLGRYLHFRQGWFPLDPELAPAAADTALSLV